MVRQIRRLTRTVPTPEGDALAVAVYGTWQDGRLRTVEAKESGWEGVACVDDAARAAWLYLDVWERYRIPGARDIAEGYLAFVRSMQQPDGRFVNFISSWDGACNHTGCTSDASGPWWNARAVMALARSAYVLESSEDLERVRRVWPEIQDAYEYPEVRPLHILAALELERSTGEVDWLLDVRAWSEAIMDCRDPKGHIRNEPHLPSFHFWGHIQPAALALAGARLQWPEYIQAAEQSARLLIEPMVRGGFALPRVQPYDVSSCITSLKALFQVTSRPEYLDLLHLARAWFYGRNPAGEPVYNAIEGCCYDGVDSRIVSRNSGAESNIEAAFALMEELPWPLMLPTVSTPGAEAEAEATAVAMGV